MENVKILTVSGWLFSGGTIVFAYFGACQVYLSHGY